MPESRRREENSGLIDLDALLKEASDPHLPAARPADDSLEGIAAAPPPEPPAPVPKKPVAPIAVIKSVPPPTRRSSRAVLVAIAALAAALVLLVVRLPSSSSPPPARAIAPPRATSVVATTTTTTTTAAPPSEETLAARDLPAAKAEAQAKAPAPPPPAIVAAKVTTVALPDAPSERGDLGGAMRDAVGSRDRVEDAPPADAPAASGARQLRPSPGAVVGAINAVLPAARACLGPDDPVRSATIVFRSDGAVARVEMSGDRPTDPCVRAALARARVAPFVDDTFAARATVRP